MIKSGTSRRRKGRMRVPAALALSAVLTLMLGAGSAHAARGLVTGFADSALFESPNPGDRALWLDRAVGSDAGLVRLTLAWRSVAPSQPIDPTNPDSPSYHFDRIDAAIRDARARGLAVMVTVQGAPDWAEGPGRPASAAPGTWKPNPSSLAEFMRAVAARYSGGFDPAGLTPPLPAIQAIQVWNEPNLLEYLTPQYDGTAPVSPDWYRMMLNDSYAAIKSVNRSIQVVTAGTSPYGGPSSQGLRLRPVEFDRRLFCLRQVKSKRRAPKKGKKGKRKRRKTTITKLVRDPGCPAPANFDILAHHPINTSGGPLQHAFNADDASSNDLGRITRVLQAAEQARTVTPGAHPVWATEIWWDSDPPNRAGSPLARQARWLEQSMYLVWRAGASAVLNLRIRDVSAVSSGQTDGSGSGIFFTSAEAKPSAVAFRFPFVADRLGKKKSNKGVLAWGKSPAAGRLVIQRRARHRWVAMRRIHVARGGVFAVRLRPKGKKLRLRAVVAGNRSLVWKQG